MVFLLCYYENLLVLHSETSSLTSSLEHVRLGGCQLDALNLGNQMFFLLWRQIEQIDRLLDLIKLFFYIYFSFVKNRSCVKQICITQIAAKCILVVVVKFANIPFLKVRIEAFLYIYIFLSLNQAIKVHKITD